MTVEEALAIAKTTLDHKRFNKVQELVFRQSWQGHSYQEIAESSGYGMGYIKDAGSKLWQLLSEAFGEKVTKNNLHSVLKRYVQRTRVVAAISETSRLSADIQVNGQNPKTNEFKGVPSFGDAPRKPDSLASFAATLNEDWGDAIDVSVFYGRTAELIELKQWIVPERCRLVMLLGIGGIGKTVLSIKLAEQIQEHFDYVIWRSLRNVPLIQDLLLDLIQFLSNQQETDIPGSLDGKISRLLKYLRSSRCLLVLDNIESILRWGTRMGGYSEGCEGYGELFRRLGEEHHNSCLILTSREKPKELAALESKVLPVRSFQLTGLPVVEGQKIFQLRGNFYGSETEWKVLIEHYAGNPLVLKMIAPAIRDFFDGNIFRFLEFLVQGTFILDDIRNLLDQQFNRLTNLEKLVMHWLAINREPTSFLELQKDLLPKVSPIELLETLTSLQRRSLIEKSSTGFTQQPIVMEYMTEQLDRTANSINLQKDCFH